MSELSLFEATEESVQPKRKKRQKKVTKNRKKSSKEELMDSLFNLDEEFDESEMDVTDAEAEAATAAIGLAYFIKATNRYKLYSFEEEQKIFEEYKRTQSIEIRNQILCANIKLVIMVAKKAAKLNSRFEIDDMIGDGVLGLIRAIEKFEPERKLKFSTYAYPWIKQNITRAIANTGDTIRLPVHFSAMINKINKVDLDYCQENGCESAPDEAIMEKLDLSEDKLNRFKTAARVTNSLDSDISNASEKSHFVSYQDLLVDENSPTPEDALEDKMWMEEFIQTVNETLSPREIYIIRHRYGIDNSEEMTLDVLSKKLNLTRERIRQIEAQALEKLKEPFAAFAS